jgi:signal transduction histidine kinase
MPQHSRVSASLKIKRLHIIFIIYWFLLAYIIAALVWWYIALMQQNEILADYKLLQQKDTTSKQQEINMVYEEKKRKTAQYTGEGATFLLLIIAGAIFIYRVVKKQFKQARQQQNFMMAITHELKTPIAVTKLNLETLQKHKLSTKLHERLITNTLQEANRLNDLCNNMLLAGQIEAKGYQVTNEEINLTSLVSECVHDFIIRYPQRNIKADLEPDIYLTGDRLLLQIAINNLIDNAVKYSLRDTSVWIELKKGISIISLLVKDEGKGIPDQEKERVFNKFYRLGNKHTREAKGTGLGLYLTKRIIQQHNGTIIVTDNQPYGSNFVINFKD